MKNLTKTRELTPKGKVLKAFILREQKQREQRKMKFKDPFESIDLRLKKVHSIIEELKKKFKK
jgi:ppGpp synthetase/RelA/SpoT-type nucleotidyltranferase